MSIKIEDIRFSTNTLGEILGVDPGTIRWWVRKKKLQANRTSKRGNITVTGDQFVTFLKQNPDIFFEYRTNQHLNSIQKENREVILELLQDLPRMYSFVELTNIFHITKCAIYYWINQQYLPVAYYDSFHAPVFTAEGIEQFLNRFSCYRKNFTDYNRREIQY